MPKVRIQAPLEDGWTWVNDLIVDAARLADGPEYPARPNGHCKSCAFRFMCPAQSAAPLGSRRLAATLRERRVPGRRRGRQPRAEPRTRPRPADPGRRRQPRPRTPEVPVQQSLWGDDL